ncbi:MAG: bifunctional phosphoribosyl-AMP cyclohydrolase/phosphoribosyl-ATP diphosphatase HisIE [Campylobacteraceae bacterium]
MKIDWSKTPLVPAIAQDIVTNEVLMLAYMNEEAFNLSQQTGIAHYFSRSKQRIWKKGESSGNIQNIKEMILDCDADTILLKVEQIGVACHTGHKSCFFTDAFTCKEKNENIDTQTILHYGVLDKLYHTILERKNANPETSYVAKLLSKGENSYLKKVVEEAGEFTFAVKDNKENEIIYEGADLLFHMLVALGDKNIHPDRLEQELARRFGLSGIEEKNNRTKK